MQETFSTLNGLRGVAALAVVIHHAKPFWGFDAAPVGYLAVDLFFILSGFIIAHAYDAKLPAMGVLAFGWVRVVRFYPLYLLGLTLGAAVFCLELLLSPPASLTTPEIAGAYGLGLMFMPAPFDGDLYPLNLPAWTLGLELGANILFAVCHRYITVLRLITVIVLAAAALVVLSLEGNSVSMGPQVASLPGGIARTVFGFSLGVLLYRSNIRLRFNPALLAIALGVVLVMPVPAEWAVVYCLVCILVVFPSMVAAGSSPAGRLEGVFEWLGRMSYGIYSVHYPLIWLALAGTTIVEFDKAAIGVTLVVALIVIADPLHNLDLRIRRWIRSAFPIVRPAR